MEKRLHWQHWLAGIVGVWRIGFTGARAAFRSAIVSGLVIRASAARDMFGERQAGHA